MDRGFTNEEAAVIGRLFSEGGMKAINHQIYCYFVSKHYTVSKGIDF